MAPAPGSTTRLQVLRAVEDGWTAFCRAPWPFMLFTLLVGALSLVFQGLSSLGELPEAVRPPLALLVASGLVGTAGQVLVSLWGMVGLIRGSWSALEGRRPDWSTFSRWDGGSAGRLFLRQILFGLLLILLVLLTVLVAAGVALLQQLLALIPLLVGLLVLTYLLVGQTFLPWLALLSNQGPVTSLTGGHRMVDRQWWWVGLLLLVQSGILLLGFLLCGIGLLAAWPLSLCISTAAYRQLFGAEDHTGLMAGPFSG